MSFQSAQFRQTLGTFATGITVISAEAIDGEMAGVTANSFTSVSLEPPLILWCLATSADSLEIFKSASYFAVNILSSTQKEISDHFAKKQTNKFKPIKYTPGKGGAPLIADCVAWFQCRVTEKHEIGDHWVFVGEVEEFTSTNKEALLYHHGTYAISLPLPESEQTQNVTIHENRFSDESLYSLLLQAIHAYQERFEARQNQYAKNHYEARILSLLRETAGMDINILGQKIQVPKAEIAGILEDLKNRDLIMISDINTGGFSVVKLTETGVERAEKLWELARQHEADVLALFRKGGVDNFRQNLIQLIKWEG